MKKMPDNEEFCKRAVEILGEAIESVRRMSREREGIKDIDVMLRREMGRWAREILGLVLSERGSKAEHGESVECQCGCRAKFKQNRPYILSTVLPGKTVEIKAAYYLCETCHIGVTPLLEEGMAVEKYLNEGDGMGCGFEKEETMHVEIDGGMIHADDRWQEVKLGVIFSEGDRVETSEGRGKLMNRNAVAVRGGCDKFEESMESRLSDCNLSYRKVVVLGDGAKWIWNLAEEMFPNRVEILDYYHATEHLWLCANTVFGESSGEAREWVEKQETLLLDDRAFEVIETLKRLKTRLRARYKRKAVDDLSGYLQANLHRMRYKTCIENGYSIGSGAVESAVKHVVQSRMKRPGTRWQNQGADSMLALRCLYRSTNRWDAYWHDKNSPRLVT